MSEVTTTSAYAVVLPFLTPFTTPFDADAIAESPVVTTTLSKLETSRVLPPVKVATTVALTLWYSSEQSILLIFAGSLPPLSKIVWKIHFSFSNFHRFSLTKNHEN